MKNLLNLLLPILCFASLVCSCSDDDGGTENDFTNWQSRNDAYFTSIRSAALEDIAESKTLYLDNWQEHCNWRTYRSYSLSPSATNGKPTDSVYVEILKRGKGSGSPLSTDSVRIFYTGRLMPTDTYPEGKMFDHSGQSTIISNIFDHQKSKPATLLVNTCVRGFATALQYMHIGDLWRIYVPYELGYNSSVKGNVPAYSTLVFDVELVQYARAGNMLPAWK